MLSRWYAEVKQFLELNNVDEPARVWNADETGRPLCPKSGKVLALAGTRDVFQATTDTKSRLKEEKGTESQVKNIQEPVSGV